jgi:hypothetical protein
MATADRSFLSADFIDGDRLGLGVERVKEKNKIILRESGKVRIHWGKRGKTTGEKTTGEEGKPIPCRIP